PNTSHTLGLLRARRERPRRSRAAEQRDELTALQWIELHRCPPARPDRKAIPLARRRQVAWELFHNPPTSLSPVRVIRVAPTGSKASPNVRYAFNNDRICASQRTDAMCQEATYASQRTAPLFNN